VFNIDLRIAIDGGQCWKINCCVHGMPPGRLMRRISLSFVDFRPFEMPPLYVTIWMM
jgi:hypothetical protein